MVDGTNKCNGRVEVYYAREAKWKTVCDYSWGMSDAVVVCRQIGCGRALGAPGNTVFGYGKDGSRMTSVRCSGRESALKQCRHNIAAAGSSCRKDQAGVICEPGKCEYI